MKILIIEDEHKIANSIKKGLEQETYTVDVAYDGITGYDLASSESYDVIVADIMLPGMNGVEICTKLRREQVHTPIIMLTAKGELDDKITSLNAGADDYLVKPFAFAELVARVRALARRPIQSTTTTLTYSDIELNSLSFTVTRNGTPIQLSRKEFALLEYLMRHPKQIVTKEQIMQNVWDYDSDILPNTVEVYIGYLRGKIDKPFQKSLIHTKRSFGYKLE